MSSPSKSEGQRRLFLALWPEDAERRQLAALAASVAGRRRIRDANLHLTLVFLGATDPDRLAAYQIALADLPIPSLTLMLDRYGYWPQSRILWLGCNETPPKLVELLADLHQRLRRCGFTPERRAFQAHVTLARHFPGPLPKQAPTSPIHWPVASVALVESLQGESGCYYRVLNSWSALRSEG